VVTGPSVRTHVSLRCPVNLSRAFLRDFSVTMTGIVFGRYVRSEKFGAWTVTGVVSETFRTAAALRADRTVCVSMRSVRSSPCSSWPRCLLFCLSCSCSVAWRTSRLLEDPDVWCRASGTSSAHISMTFAVLISGSELAVSQSEELENRITECSKQRQRLTARKIITVANCKTSCSTLSIFFLQAHRQFSSTLCTATRMQCTGYTISHSWTHQLTGDRTAIHG
jgi:hypothetical protein